MRFTKQAGAKLWKALLWGFIISILLQTSSVQAECKRDKRASEIVCLWPGDDCCWMKQRIEKNGKEVWKSDVMCVDEHD